MSLLDELYCTIDVESREISIPPGLEIVGVESDENVTVRKFIMPYEYDDFDLSTFSCRVNFENADGTKGVYSVTDAVKSDGDIVFSWMLSRTAMAKAGALKFVICMIKHTPDGKATNEWNSTQGQFIVLEGLNVEEG